jgi:hypothetical protein
MKRTPTLHVALAALPAVLSLTGCVPLDARVVHPAELTGKWVRLRADGTWGDTLEYLADGRILGSAGRPVPATARWDVVRSRVAGEGLCTSDGPKKGRCQIYRLEGDTLVLGYIKRPAYFRRAH